MVGAQVHGGTLGPVYTHLRYYSSTGPTETCPLSHLLAAVATRMFCPEPARPAVINDLDIPTVTLFLNTTGYS